MFHVKHFDNTNVSRETSGFFRYF